MVQPIIDVVVLSYRPDTSLRKLLNGLRKQTQSIHRIILINTDQNCFRDSDFEGIVPYEIHHIKTNEFDHAATRRMGMELAQEADFVLMMTQDAIPADDTLVERLLEGMRAKGEKGEQVAVAYARQIPKKGCSESERFTRNLNYPNKSRVKTKADEREMGLLTYFCSDVCALYDRGIYEACGGYVSRTIFNEDMLFAFRAMRAGYAVHYVAGARVVHSHDYNGRQQFKRYFDMGVSQAEHPEVFGRVSSESAGATIVWRTCRYLARKGRWMDIPGMLCNQIAKYAGFLCGKNYRILGKSRCKRMSANPSYWE